MNIKPTFPTFYFVLLLILALALTSFVPAYAQAGRFAVQFGAYPTRDEADAKVAQLKAKHAGEDFQAPEIAQLKDLVDSLESRIETSLIEHKLREDIKTGEHAHVQNIKTKRW